MDSFFLVLSALLCITNVSSQPPSGTPPSGDPSSGGPPSGTPPSVTPPSGDPSSGTPPSGDPSSGTPPSGDPARNPLFDPLVQDFVADAFEQFQNEVDDLDIVSVKKISPDEAYSVFYQMVYDAQQKAGNPDARFHAQCKAQSVRENYQYADGSYMILTATYTAGELLLQNEILTPSNQKSLSSNFVRDVIDAVMSVTDPTVANYLKAADDGFLKFLTSQGLFTKKTAFTDPAVFTEVINALRLYY